MIYFLRILLLSVLIASFLTGSTAAQDAYRLHTPEANDYLSGLLAIFEDDQLVEELFTTRTNLHFSSAITTEWLLRYDNTVTDPDLIADIFYVLKDRIGLNDRDVFGRAVIKSLLDHDLFALNSTEPTHAQFRDFEIDIIPRDFDGDRHPEWLLDAQSPDYQQLFVVAHENAKYRLIDTPLPWFGCCFSIYDYHRAHMEEQLFEDLTGDGVPEWVLAVGSVGGGHRTRGYLMVLQWQAGQLVDVTPAQSSSPTYDDLMNYAAPSGGGSGDHAIPLGITISFADTDTNGTTEILITQDFRDNWECDLTGTRVFGWDETINEFALAGQTWEYTESAGCALRLAQDAMWRGDVVAAIPLFELAHDRYRALDLADFNEWSYAQIMTFDAYAQVRLALAYSIQGRTEDAAAVLAALTPPETYSPITELVTAAQATFQADQTALDLCITLYNVFDAYFDQGYGTDPYWGDTWNVVVPYMGMWVGGPNPQPDHAGCDAPAMISARIAADDLSTAANLIEQLSARDIPVAGNLSADFTGDGNADQLVWFAARISPYLFIANDAVYDALPVTLDNPVEGYHDFEVFTLPDGLGAGLADWYPSSIELFKRTVDSLTCVDPQGAATDITSDPDLPIVLQLYRWQDDDLVTMQRIYMCERRPLADIFAGRELHGWRLNPEPLYVYPEGDTQLEPAIFHWDSDLKTYVLPPAVTNPPAAEAAAEHTEFYPVSYHADMRFGHHDHALELVDAALASYDPALDEYSPYKLRYYRALALEWLDRPAEALAEYYAIYEAAPDSAWGKLAALHLDTGS